MIAWHCGSPTTLGNKARQTNVSYPYRLNIATMFLHNIYDSKRIWKTIFIIVALLMVGVFLYFSDNMVRDLAAQERERMQIWANATKELASMSDGSSNANVDFLFGIIEGNHNIPVLLVDGDGSILLHRTNRMR